MAGFAAGCSSDPFTTGAITPGPIPPRPVGDVGTYGGGPTTPPQAAAPSNAVTATALPPVAAGPDTYAAPTYPTLNDPAYGGTAVATAPAPTALPSPAPVANAAPALVQQQTAVAAAPAQSVTITAAPGDTLYSLSRRHGVSVAAIAAANGLTQTSTLLIGQRLVIPAANSTAALGPAPLGTIGGTQAAPAAAAPQAVAAAAAPAAAPTTTAGQHIVSTGETMYSIAMRYSISVVALQQANNMQTAEFVRVGQRLVIPAGARVLAAVPQTQMAAVAPIPAAATAPVAATTTGITPTPVTAAPRQPVQVAAAAPTALPTPAPTPAPAAVTAAPQTNVAAARPPTTDTPSPNGTSFRWPVQGRIIANFGPRPGGERNDGINLAVPAGTEIHAAEAGVVIYAGNEIPGYGNLILVRHADNWVTAYAHASSIMVQRDQTVRRGDTLGLVGQTGSVSSPQLHFELRRGSTPVNPMDYIN